MWCHCKAFSFKPMILESTGLCNLSSEWGDPEEQVYLHEIMDMTKINCRAIIKILTKELENTNEIPLRWGWGIRLQCS